MRISVEQPTQLSLGSLFSGVGGLDLGMEQAGFSVRWFCEADKAARGVLAHHWPDVPCYEDVRDVRGDAVEPVDVIAGGFPCQDISVAGKREGLAGARSGLFHEFMRIVREMREATDGAYPVGILAENVVGLLSSHRGRDFGIVLNEMAGTGAVDIGWRVIDAQHFVPQRRRRVFIVALYPPTADGRVGVGRAAEILANGHTVRHHPQAGNAARQETTIGAGDGTADSGEPIPFDLKNITSKANRSRAEAGMPAPTLHQGADSIAIAWSPVVAGERPGNNSGGFRQDLDTSGAYIIQAVNKPRANPEYGIGGDTDAVCYTLTAGERHAVAYGIRTAQTGANGIGIAENVAHTLDSAGQAVAFALPAREGKGPNSDCTSGNLVIAFAQNQREELRDLGDVAGALAAQPGTHQQTFIAQQLGVRRLMPIECERLMGWAKKGDPYIHTAVSNGKQQADTPRYVQCGNGVVSDVAAWIGERLAAALLEERAEVSA